MGKGGSQKQQVNEYNMSIHYGICAEVDAVTGIYVGEKQAWSGDVTAYGPIAISREDLFGGPKKEGGVRGVAFYLPGTSTQVLPEGLAARRGLTSATHNAYRGLASIYFVGGVEGGGFYWGATPYIQGVWITARRAPKGLNPDYALIGNQFAATVDGYEVTVGGVTATVPDGVTTVVGTHSANISVNGVNDIKTIIVDGLTVIIQPWVDVGEDQEPGITVTVEGNTGVLENGTITLAGVTVAIDNDDVVSISMGSSGQDANPAHIIYECLTNGSWGMGAGTGIVDTANHEAVGQVLFNEGFGMSLQWTRESTIEAFIGEVLDHIQAALYVDPETGKLTLKLFRDDYDSTTLPLISPDNAVLDNFQRKLWGETVNEITVTWTNPANEQEETITQQDLGNIVVQGATVSDSRNYYGVRNSDLASRLAIRDVRQSSAPLVSVEALLDRSSWNLKPGSVVRLTWPEYSIANLVMRVVNIDYGKIGSPSITVTLLEDIFSLEDASFTPGATSGFIDPAQDPTAMDHVNIITAPAYFTSRRLTSADAAALTYPDVMVALLGASSNTDAAFYEMVGQTTLPNGTTASEQRGTKGLLGWSVLPSALPCAITSSVAFGDITNGIGPTVAGFVFIGGGTERTMEIALIESITSGVATLRRGVLDTVPRAWPTGTPIWFYDQRNDFFDTDLHSEGENVAYKLLTITSKGTLAVADSPVYGATLTARPHLPLRPANVRFDGISIGPVDPFIDFSFDEPETIEVTWSNRNRLMEDGTVLKWNDATVTPETGQTTTLSLYKTSDGTLINSYDELTGTSYELDVAVAFDGEFEADIVLTSSRDGLESLQGLSRRVRVAPDDSDIEPPAPGDGGDTGYEPPQTGYPPEYPPPQYCPEETTLVLLANGEKVPAGELIVGDWVWTQHEHTMEWGAYRVTAVETIEADVLRAEGFPRATAGHRFHVDGDWVAMAGLGKHDGTARVVKITVEDAHTYVTVEGNGRQILSHNIKYYEDQL